MELGLGRAPSLLFSYPGEALAGDGASGGGGGGSGSVNSAVVGIVVGSRFDDVVVGRFHELAGDGGGGFILVLSSLHSLSPVSTRIVLVLKSERVHVCVFFLLPALYAAV